MGAGMALFCRSKGENILETIKMLLQDSFNVCTSNNGNGCVYLYRIKEHLFLK